MECTVPFTSQSVSVLSPKNDRGSWIQHILCSNAVINIVTRARLCGKRGDYGPLFILLSGLWILLGVTSMNSNATIQTFMQTLWSRLSVILEQRVIILLPLLKYIFINILLVLCNEQYFCNHVCYFSPLILFITTASSRIYIGRFFLAWTLTKGWCPVWDILFILLCPTSRLKLQWKCSSDTFQQIAWCICKICMQSLGIIRNFFHWYLSIWVRK
jgi:hypothetical protein